MLINTGIVIVAGGSSRRYGKNKLQELLGGLPVFIHPVINFRTMCPDENIVLVCNVEFLDEYRRLVYKYIPGCRMLFATGGEKRHDSVINGLNALNPSLEFVAIHDAARPLSTPELLEKCVKACALHGSGVAASRITDTVKKTDENCFVEKTIDRNNLWSIQTPQVFRLNELKQAYLSAIKDMIPVTDDAGAMEYAGHKVFLVENTSPNLKITWSSDLNIAEYLLQGGR